MVFMSTNSFLFFFYLGSSGEIFTGKHQREHKLWRNLFVERSDDLMYNTQSYGQEWKAISISFPYILYSQILRTVSIPLRII